MIFNTVVVIPVYKQFNDLKEAEKISLIQTYKVLNKYDIYLVTHEFIDIGPYKLNTDIKFILFNELYFKNISGYNKLLMSKDFYNSFKTYDYMLLCQLDVFIFSDMVDYFTKQKFDYIGAPWFEGFHLASNDSKIIGVGNGGLSLRKINAFISTLNIFEPLRNRKMSMKNLGVIIKNPIIFSKIIKHELVREKNNYLSILPWLFPNNEDEYWCTYIKGVFTDFNISSIEIAIAFAFEVNPVVLYYLNDKKLPMGVHAWEKYNPEFWMPFIEDSLQQ